MPTDKYIYEQIARFIRHTRGMASTAIDIKAQKEELARVYRKYCTDDAMVQEVTDNVMDTAEYFPLPAHIFKAVEKYKADHEETESQRATRMEREYVQSINSPNLAEEDEAYRKEALKLKERNKVVIHRREPSDGKFLF